MEPLSDLAREIIQSHPTVTAHRTLAKLLLGKYPMRFKDIEAARTSIRNVMGKRGEKYFNKSGFNSQKNQTFLERLARLRAESRIEEVEHEDTSPYFISNKFKKILVISDQHIPYIDMAVLDVSLEYGYKESVDAVVINGDFLDFGTISKYISKPNAPRVVESIEQGKEVLKYIKAALGCKIILHTGNHCQRLENYLVTKAPELFQLPSVQLESLLDLKKMNIDYVSNLRTMRYGKLTITHGNNVVKGVFAPVNAARGAFTKANCSILISHVHRTSSHLESDIKGNIIGAWSIGSMTSNTPEYNCQVSKFNNGFAVVTLLDKEGNFKVDNKVVDKGKLY